MSGVEQGAVILHLENALRLARGDDLSTPMRLATANGDKVLEAAKLIYQSRRRRDIYFGHLGCEFGEPGWDILLDLFIAGREGRLTPVSSACIAAAVPATTGLRWIAHMEDRGLIARHEDPRDKRRSLLELTDGATQAVERYLATELLPRSSA